MVSGVNVRVEEDDGVLGEMVIPPSDVTREPLGWSQVTVGTLVNPVITVDTLHSSVYSCPTVAESDVVMVTTIVLGGDWKEDNCYVNK